MNSEEEKGLIALLVVSSLSTLATLSVILVYLFNREFRSFSHDLVIMLCASDFLYSLVGLSRSVWMLMDSDAYISGVSCYIQAVYIQTFDISSSICTTSISYSLYLQMVKRVILSRNSAFRMYWVRNYLLPLFFSLIFAAFKLVGHNQPYENTYCTVCSDNPTMIQILQMIYFYIPQVTCLIFNAVMIALVLRAYLQNRHDFEYISFKEMISLTVYPLILLFCQIPLIVVRIMEYQGAYYEKTTIVMYVMSQSTGFLNALFYAILSLRMFSCQCFSTQTLQHLKRTLTLRSFITPQNYQSDISSDLQDTTNDYSQNQKYMWNSE